MECCNNRFYIKRAVGLMVGALCLFQLPLAALAESGAANSVPQYDVVSPEPSPASASASEPLLFGGVTKKRTLLDTGAKQNQSQDEEKNLKAETPSTDVYQLALEKLSENEKLTSEEYRSLGVGVAGCDIYQPFFQSIGHVERVYVDSPADNAGIKVGDKVVIERDPKSEAMARANPRQPLYQATFAREGTTVDIILLRHNQPVKLTLTRMNIEDIKEAEYRHMWEQLISKLGNPQEGKFTGTSLKTLERD